MNIKLIKKSEDDTLVYYEAVLDDVYEINTDGTCQCTSKLALIIYNKTSFDINFVWDQTDSYYKKNKNRADHMLRLIFGKMRSCQKEGNFPEKTGIATG